MIFDISESLRLFIIFVPQLFLLGVFFFLIYKILKRNKNRSSLILSGFYFIVSIGFLMNIIAVLIAFFAPGLIIAFFYFAATYLIIFSFIFIIIFIISLLKLKYIFTLKKATIIVISYGIVWLLLHFYPGGITYSENWTPVYSPPLFYAVNILFTVTITLPAIIYSSRLYKLFKDAALKRKLRLFLLGVTMTIVLVYGVLLYNTWQDPTYKTVWGLTSIVLLISSGLLIYFGIGRDL